MVAVSEWNEGAAPGMSADRFNEPFHVSGVSYSAGTDTITVTVGLGRVDWGGGNITEFTSEETLEITPVAINTTYYVFLDKATSGLVYTTQAAPSGTRIRLGSVATGASKATLTRTDLRGMLPGGPSEIPIGLFYMGGF